MTGNARAEAGRGMSNATRQTLAEAANGSRGTARNSPGGNSQSTGSAQGSNASSALAGTGSSESFSPSAGTGRAGTGVMANGARAEAGRGMSNATRQTLAEAASGSRGSARNNPGGSDLPNAGSAASANQSGTVAGSGQRGGFSPALTGGGARGNGVSTAGARSVAGRGMAGANNQALAQAATGDFGSSRVRPAGSLRTTNGARGNNSSSATAGAGSPGMLSPNTPSTMAARMGTRQPGGALGGAGMADAGNVPSPRVTGSRLGGGAVNTDQVMRQIGSGSLAGPMRMMSSRVRPDRTRTQARSTQSIPISGLPSSSSQTSTGQLTPSTTVVTPNVPTLEQIQPEQVASPTFEQPDPLNSRVMQNPPRPEETLVAAKPNESNPANATPLSDLQKFRTQGFQTQKQGRGKNFVFIIDRSDSMSQDSRLAAAKQALASTMEKLQPDQNFYIYFFGDETFHMTNRRLMTATPGNISSTRQWVQSMKPGGLTNPRDALTDAFEKLNPSTIWLLSDGKFTSVKRIKYGSGRTRLLGLPSVQRVVRKLNTSKGVRINTIGFAAREDQVDASLKDIAKENGGTYSFIRSNEK